MNFTDEQERNRKLFLASPENVLRVFQQLAQGLSFLHNGMSDLGQGMTWGSLGCGQKFYVLHRDIKPANIIFNEDYSEAKLIDLDGCRIFAEIENPKDELRTKLLMSSLHNESFNVVNFHTAHYRPKEMPDIREPGAGLNRAAELKLRKCLLKRGKGKACDVFALGRTFRVLLNGVEDSRTRDEQMCLRPLSLPQEWETKYPIDTIAKFLRDLTGAMMAEKLRDTLSAQQVVDYLTEALENIIKKVEMPIIITNQV